MYGVTSGSANGTVSLLKVLFDIIHYHYSISTVLVTCDTVVWRSQDGHGIVQFVQHCVIVVPMKRGLVCSLSVWFVNNNLMVVFQ